MQTSSVGSFFCSDRDRELAAYWTERADLRAWLAGIIAATRCAEREACANRAGDAMHRSGFTYQQVIDAIRKTA